MVVILAETVLAFVTLKSGRGLYRNDKFANRNNSHYTHKYTTTIYHYYMIL